MKKLIVVIIVLVVVSLGGYFLVSKKGANVTSTETPNFSSTALPEISNSNGSVPTVSVNITPKTSVPASVTININNFVFNPPVQIIKAGTKVIWINNDSAAHTVTSDTGSLLNSSAFSSGNSFSFIFTKAGTVDYHCSIHTAMRARIIVE